MSFGRRSLQRPHVLESFASEPFYICLDPSPSPPEARGDTVVAHRGLVRLDFMDRHAGAAPWLLPPTVVTLLTSYHEFVLDRIPPGQKA